MRSTIAKKIQARTTQAIKDKVKHYSQEKLANFNPSLFGFTKPTSKVPISAERLKEAKALMAAGKPKESAAILRELRYKLEDFEKRITAKP